MRILFWRKKKLTHIEELQKLRDVTRKKIKELQGHISFAVLTRKKYSQLYSKWRRNVVNGKETLIYLGGMIPLIDRKMKEEIARERESIT